MLNLESAWNQLSFGNISYGIGNELCERDIKTNIFPIGGNVDIGVFDKISDKFKSYLQDNVNNALKKFKRSYPYFRIWHINGSWHKISEPSNLLTFHECDALTDIEVNILNSYSKVFVTSTFSKQVFEDFGVKCPVVYVPMGFDSVHYYKTDKPRPLGDAIVFSIIGKFEARKHTKKTIQTWIKKFGGNHKYRLHLLITNPFFKPEQMNAVYADIFGGQRPPFNITILGFQGNNTLMNECINTTDIILDCSGGETISIPSLTCACLGKQGVILDATGMKDWLKFAPDIVKIRINGKEPMADGIFFHPGEQPFNIGNKYCWDEDEFLAGCDEAISRFEKNPNSPIRTELQNEYNYKKGVDIILKEIGI